MQGVMHLSAAGVLEKEQGAEMRVWSALSECA